MSTIKVRLIGHSMGARVTLSTLDSSHTSKEWNSKNFKIASVHLIGGGVDPWEVAKDPLFIVNNASILKDTSEWYNVY